MEIIDSVITDFVITDSVTYSLARDSNLLLIVFRLKSVTALVTIKLWLICIIKKSSRYQDWQA